MASANTVSNLLLRSKITINEKWLPAETACMILLPTESLGRSRIMGTVVASSYLSPTAISVGKKRLQTVPAEAKYDGQSRQAGISDQVVDTLCYKAQG